MIRARWLILAGAMLLALASRAGAQASAEAIVDKAIEAHGGIKALERARILTSSQAGKFVAFATETPFTSDLIVDLPDRYRHTMLIGEEKKPVVNVLNRNQGWFVNGGTTTPMGRDVLTEARDEGFAFHVSKLAPLRREKGFTLQSMPEAKHQGKAVLVVKASMKDRDDIVLSFDKETNLLVKMSRKAALGGLTVDKDYYFDGHKVFNGAKLPTKLQELLNGRKCMDYTISSYRFHEKADDKEFAKP